MPAGSDEVQEGIRGREGEFRGGCGVDAVGVWRGGIPYGDGFGGVVDGEGSLPVKERALGLDVAYLVAIEAGGRLLVLLSLLPGLLLGFRVCVGDVGGCGILLKLRLRLRFRLRGAVVGRSLIPGRGW